MKPESGVHIRPFAALDLEACEALLAREIQSGVANFNWSAPPKGQLERRWQELAGHYPWLSLESDGRWAGLASATPYRAREAYKWTAEIGIYLEPDARGRGLGRLLLAELLKQLAQAGFRLAVANITLPGEASIRLHRGLGFDHVGTLEQVGWKAGAWRDVSLWQRRLGPPSSVQG